uniref:Uncharacterized protein n=1 Tax=Noccaea caerulescens TaxID=107243 RepID=A0A1J3HU28_NOCCA
MRSSECSETVAQAIHTCISAETNENLIAAPTSEEIKAELFSIHPNKAPGPDGFLVLDQWSSSGACHSSAWNQTRRSSIPIHLYFVWRSSIRSL